MVPLAAASAVGMPASLTQRPSETQGGLPLRANGGAVFADTLSEHMGVSECRTNTQAPRPYFGRHGLLRHLPHAMGTVATFPK